MFQHIAKILLRNRLLFISLIVGLTAFFGYHARFVKISYKEVPLLGKNDSVYLLNNRMSKLFGKGDNIMILGVQDSLFFKSEHLRQWVDMEQRIRSIPDVEQVFSAVDAVNFVKNAAAKKFNTTQIFNLSNLESTLDSSQHIFSQQAFYKGLLYNPETSCYLMLITLNKERIHARDRVSFINSIVETTKKYEQDTGLKLRYSGLPYMRTVIGALIEYEMYLFVILAAIVAAVILYLLFRSFRPMLISILVVGISVVWCLGSVALMGYDLTILTGVVPSLLIIIGIPNCIYLINKYHNEIYAGSNRATALYNVINRIGSATFLTNFTTAAGFATFMMTKTQLFKEFGLVASINIVGIFIISLIVIPIIYSYLPIPSQKQLWHLSKGGFKNTISSIVKATLYKRKSVFITAAVIVVIGLFGLTLVKSNGYVIDDVPRNHDVLRDMKFFEKNFVGIMALDIIYDTQKPNGYLNANTFTKIDALEKRLEKYPVISRPLSIVEVSKFARQAYFNGNESHYRLPGAYERAFILSYIPRSVGISDMFAQIVDSTGQYARLTYNVADIGSVEVDKLITNIRADVDSVFRDKSSYVKITGASVVSTRGIQYLVNNLFSSLLMAILIISLTIAWLFRRFRMVLFALVVNVIPLILTGATMGYFNINLKPSTVIVFSIAFGIAVDNSIHFLSKYRQELRRTNKNVKESVFFAIRETGVSMIYTSIVLFFGFGVFAASSFGGTQALGILVAITLLFAVLVNLFVLPSIILRFDRKPTVACQPELDIDTGFEEGATEETQKLS